MFGLYGAHTYARPGRRLHPCVARHLTHACYQLAAFASASNQLAARLLNRQLDEYLSASILPIRIALAERTTAATDKRCAAATADGSVAAARGSRYASSLASGPPAHPRPHRPAITGCYLPRNIDTNFSSKYTHGDPLYLLPSFQVLRPKLIVRESCDTSLVSRHSFNLPKLIIFSWSCSARQNST